jgi:hypothetical protein
VTQQKFYGRFLALFLLIGVPAVVYAQGGPPGSDSVAANRAPLLALMVKMMRENNPPPLDKLPPPPSDPRILQGTWIADQLTALRVETDMYGNPLPFSAKGQQVIDRRMQANYVQHKPYANAGGLCLPPGQPWQLGMIYPFHLFQTKNALEVVFSEGHVVWGVPVGGTRFGAPHGGLQYMGDSRAHWDGDTLVIETSNFKQPLWFDADGTPISPKAQLTFRLRRIDYGDPKLEIVTTVNDPVNFTQPWSIVRTYLWRPDFALFKEFDCEKNVSAPDFLSQYSYQIEPKDAQ